MSKKAQNHVTSCTDDPQLKRLHFAKSKNKTRMCCLNYEGSRVYACFSFTARRVAVVDNDNLMIVGIRMFYFYLSVGFFVRGFSVSCEMLKKTISIKSHF